MSCTLDEWYENYSGKPVKSDTTNIKTDTSTIINIEKESDSFISQYKYYIIIAAIVFVIFICIIIWYVYYSETDSSSTSVLDDMAKRENQEKIYHHSISSNSYDSDYDQ